MATELCEDAPVLERVGVCSDYNGDAIEIFTSGDEVHIEGLGAIILGPEEFDDFVRVLFEARRRTEAAA